MLMPTLEETILANSVVPIAKLYTPAKKALAAPSTGVTINNPAAEKVIQDCASVAVRYLPLLVFGSTPTPFAQLKGQVTLDQIKEFVVRSHQDVHTFQLLTVMLHMGRNLPVKKPLTTQDSAVDPYGEYENL